MMLTREQQELDTAYQELRKMSSDTRIKRYDAEMRLQKREKHSHTTPRKSTLELQMDRERRQKREDRRKAAERMMSYSTKSYSTKARIETTVIQDCYALKKKLPLSAQRQFQAEYDSTPYGLEQQLIEKYTRLYRL